MSRKMNERLPELVSSSQAGIAARCKTRQIYMRYVHSLALAQHALG
jgi:hypothetical protein